MKDTRISFDNRQKPTENTIRGSGLKRKQEHSYKEYDHGIDNTGDNHNAAIQNYKRRSLEIPSSSKYSKGRSPDVGVIIASRQGVSRSNELSLGDREPVFLHKGRGGGVTEANELWNSFPEDMQRRMLEVRISRDPNHPDVEARENHNRWWSLLNSNATRGEGQSSRGQENPSHDVQEGNEVQDIKNTIYGLVINYDRNKVLAVLSEKIQNPYQSSQWLECIKTFKTDNSFGRTEQTAFCTKRKRVENFIKFHAETTWGIELE